MSIENLVQKQLDYYNKHNLEGFLSTYSENIIIYNHKDNSIILQGKEELRLKYKERFEVFKVHAELKNRIVIGNKVIDHEEVSGIKKEEIISAVAIYEIEDKLIKKVWFIFE